MEKRGSQVKPAVAVTRLGAFRKRYQSLSFSKVGAACVEQLLPVLAHGRQIRCAPYHDHIILSQGYESYVFMYAATMPGSTGQGLVHLIYCFHEVQRTLPRIELYHCNEIMHQLSVLRSRNWHCQKSVRQKDSPLTQVGYFFSSRPSSALTCQRQNAASPTSSEVHRKAVNYTVIGCLRFCMTQTNRGIWVPISPSRILSVAPTIVNGLIPPT